MVLNINGHLLDYAELSENLALLDDWEERYSYILELGKKLPLYPEIYRNENFLVKGCVSQVWLYPDSDDKDKLYFLGDSDSQLVRGLVAIILIIYNGLRKSEINQINFKKKFEALGLSEQLTPQRSNGVFSMIQKIENYAHCN
jgi:cysteine desulfuration protein SufE